MGKTYKGNAFGGDRKKESEFNILNFRNNTLFGEPAAWSAIAPNKIWDCINAVTSAGGAVMFGLTSDGGAYSLCVLINNDKLKEYPHGKEECEKILENLTDFFTDGPPVS